MKIAVVVRQVPDLIEPLKIAASETAVDLDEARFLVNESDDHALEQALLLKETGGGSVSVVALDFGDIDNTLYSAVAKGADRVVKIEYDGPTSPPPRAAAALYAAAIEELAPDSVLIGVQAYDELEGVLAPALAWALDLPYLGVIRGVQMVDDGKVTALKEFPGAVMSRFTVGLPAVLGILTSDQPPRYVPVTRIRAAMKSAQFEERSAAFVPVVAAAIERLRVPEAGDRAEMLSGSEDDVASRIAEILTEKGLLKMSAQDFLVLTESYQGALAGISREMLAGARQLATANGGQVIALVLAGESVPPAAGLLAADRILMIEDPLLAAYSPEPYLSVLESVVARETPRALLLGSTSIGWDLAAILATRLDVPIVNGCQAVSCEGGALQVTASFFAGKLLAEVRIDADKTPAILMILPASFHPTEEAGQGQVETKPSPIPLSAGAVSFEEMILPEPGGVDLTQQDVLVGVGRGIEQEDNLEVAEELAKALGGELCASRPIVDQGWLPPTRQIGKSGMTVKPKCYLALGISGAPEHVEGMKDADLIIAINSDANAPIFDVAHYGVVGDLLDIVPALTEVLEGNQQQTK